jgi:hypothetical protein
MLLLAVRFVGMMIFLFNDSLVRKVSFFNILDDGLSERQKEVIQLAILSIDLLLNLLFSEHFLLLFDLLFGTGFSSNLILMTPLCFENN